MAQSGKDSTSSSIDYDQEPPTTSLLSSYPFALFRDDDADTPVPTLYSSYPSRYYSDIDLAAMTEVSFAKTFLAALDARPVKLSPDHVEDPRNHPARGAYILPRMPRAMSKPTGAAGGAGAAPGSERSVTVVLKSLRNPPLDLRLTSQPLHTSVLDLKGVVAAETGAAPDKIRLLFRKKPAADSKALSDLLEGDGGGDAAVVEFSVMILGGAASLPKKEEGAAKVDVAQGSSGREVLETSEFWDDLKGFLLQRIRDEKDSEELFNTFQTAWKSTR